MKSTINVNNIGNGLDTNHIANSNYIDNNVYRAARRVDYIADLLQIKLGMKEQSRPFLCKVAWRLPEDRIWSNLEDALRGKNSAGLFIYLCKKDGV